jgi:hypothetical protein
VSFAFPFAQNSLPNSAHRLEGLTGGWNVTQKGPIKKVTFRNVAFSKLELSKLTFQDCKFVDCLFIGTIFESVEFHGCRFDDCNFWKSKFTNVYLDPDCIYLDDRFKNEASNTGVLLFQALLSNFEEDRQDEFFMKADIRFRQWKRYQIPYDLSHKRISKFGAKWKCATSMTYELVAGFGYKPARFFITTIVAFLGVSLLNYHYIGSQIIVNGSKLQQVGIVDAIFYSFSILTVLGFSTVTPVTDAAKLATVFEALASIGWLGMFTSILVKRFLR